MIDYKLFLILALSLVLLYTYNRVESLKFDIEKIKKDVAKKNTIDKECKDDKCLINNANVNDKEVLDEINKLKEFLDNEHLDENILPENNLDDNINIIKQDLNKINNLENVIDLDNVKKLDSTKPNFETQKEKNLEKNTTDFSATENDLNSEVSNITSDNVIIYSNSQSDKKKPNDDDVIDELIEQIQDKRIVKEEFDIDIDYENTDKNVDLKTQELFEVSQELNTNKINNIIESNQIENNLDSSNELKDFNSYKLKELQDIAEKNNIDITKENDGKKKNKTKKELFSDINKTLQN